MLSVPTDPRFAPLRDPDLFDFIGKFALKIMKNEANAEDVRQGAYVIAMQLVLGGRGPLEGYLRPWLCRVTKNHAYSEWRKKKRAPALKEPVEMDKYPAEDERVLNEYQRELDRLFYATQEMLAKHPEHVKNVLEADGRKEAVAEAKDAAARQRRSRSREFLRNTISALVAAAIVLFVVRDRLGPRPPIPTLRWNDATLATAARELALQRCGMSMWESCLFGLEEAKQLDAAGDKDPRVQQARRQAIPAVRAEAMSDCLAEQWNKCLDGLDLARRYDPAGDDLAIVQLARSEAGRRVSSGRQQVDERSKH